MRNQSQGKPHPKPKASQSQQGGNRRRPLFHGAHASHQWELRGDAWKVPETSARGCTFTFRKNPLRLVKSLWTLPSH